MANVRFDEEQSYQPPQFGQQRSLLTRLVLATGIVSTDKAAQYVLLAIAGIAVILAFAWPTLAKYL